MQQFIVMLDLVAGGSLPGSSSASDPLVIEITNWEEAELALRVARSRSTNWAATEANNGFKPLRNTAHSFIRLTLVNLLQRTTSTLHLVDLVGWQQQAKDGTGGMEQQAPTSPSRDRDRRIASQQLASLTKLIADLAMRQDDTTGVAKPVAVRDSKLSQMLAPMLAGNTQPYMLAVVSSEPHHQADTLMTLRLSCRASTIKVCRPSQRCLSMV